MSLFSRHLQSLVQSIQPACLVWVCQETQHDFWLEGLAHKVYLGANVPWPRYQVPADWVQTFYRQQRSALNQKPLDQVMDLWQQQSAQLKSATENVMESYDVVILDGPEFLSQGDLDAVYGSRVIALKGIHSFRHAQSYARLKSDPQYYLIAENHQEDDGFAIFWKRQALRPGVSGIVHTYQAAEQLQACLESLQWCDEVLVIDMGSQDGTLEIAETCGARVLHHQKMACVDEARNFGLSQVKHAWTLVVDADERVSDALKEALQQQMALAQFDAFWLPRRNYFFGTEAQLLFPDYQLRCFRSMQVRWPGLVHTHPEVTGTAHHLPALHSFAIEHYSYTSLADFVTRQVRYADTFWEQAQFAKRLPELEMPVELLRQQYMTKLQQAIMYTQSHHESHYDWALRQLYLFSDLIKTLRIMDGRGALLNGTQRVRLSAFSYLKNALKFDYPFCESLRAIAPVCDEIVVTVARDTEDQTWQALADLQQEIPHLKLFHSDVWVKFKAEGGEVIRRACEEAMALCGGDWLWHVQADEVYSDSDVRQVRALVEQYHLQPVHAFYFRIRHYYAHYDQQIKVQGREIGWYQYCIRLIRRDQAYPIQDAWTMALNHTSPQAIVPSLILIHHYGHVREREAMRLKASYMERLYHELPADFQVALPGEFHYDRVPLDYLEKVTEPHPEAMTLRIARSHLQALKSRPRLLIITRTPQVKKGYGITMHELYGTGILQQYFEVHHLAWHYNGQEAVTPEGIYLYPSLEDPKGKAQGFRELLYRLVPDVVLLHADAQFFTAYQAELDAWKGPVVGWFTVDYERQNNPPPVQMLLNRCQRVASMAHFASQQTRKTYAGPIGWVPLGVNREHFSPLNSAEKIAIRERLGLPQNAFLFLCVANQFWRKGIEYSLQAFADLHQRYGPAVSEVQLYLHTEASDSLLELISALGLTNKVLVSRNFDPFKSPLPVQQLARLYQAADAFLLTSLGEGFGMPVLEAQACGLPLVISDNSVLREVGGDAALYIRCPGQVIGQNAECPVWLRTPDPSHAADLMYQLYRDPALQERLRENGLKQAALATWPRTASLLAAQLAQALETGTLIYDPPEPRWSAI